MKYALLAYSRGDGKRDSRSREMPPGVARVLDRPDVMGWLRLQPAESATTVRLDARRTVLTDGPFVDSKDFLGGLIMIEADNLDAALVVAVALQELDTTAAIEVRPVFEQELGSA
ncbi:MAG: YciI family protein [Solirubrobacteraceae bacterium]